MDIIVSVLGTVIIIFLKILFVLLLLLCFLLFCPVFYKGRIEFGKELLAGGRLCWLLGLVWFSFSYQEGELLSSIRLFGIDLQKVSAWREKRARRKMLKRAGKKKQAAKAEAEPEREETEEEKEIKDEQTTLVETEPSTETDWQEQEDFPEEEEVQEEESEKEKSAQRKSVKRKSTRRKRGRLSRLYGRLKRKAEWIKDAKTFWYSENTVGMVCILKDNVLHLWRKLKPKVLRGNVIFGTGDPCSTGQILGVAAVFYALYGKGIQVVPDFEEARLEGNLFIKGRISLITIVVILLRIVFSREWSRFRQEAKQLKEAL